MSDIIKALEKAILEELGASKPERKPARVELKEQFGVILGEEMTVSDIDLIMAGARKTGQNPIDFGLHSLRAHANFVLAAKGESE